MRLHGHHLIGGKAVASAGAEFRGRDARTGEELPVVFREAGGAEVEAAMRGAAEAFEGLRRSGAEDRAALLEAIAEEVEGLGEALIALADRETGLGEGRLVGERARCCMQARLFARLIREGSWVDARIEHAIPERKPLPKPDLRLMHRPVGPVVVFGASNFPFAISVAGTDTISALGAGCPVVVKAHPAHPGTCEMMGGAIVRAVERCGMPAGAFGLLHGRGHEVGMALVEHPFTEVVAFTGSLRGGRALFDAAQRRPRPIPFYGEMGSLNPVFLLPGALRERGAAIAEGYVQALTLGTGQFCTNPSVVLGQRSGEFDGFLKATREKVAGVPASAMLHEGIRSAYESGVERLRSLEGVGVLAEGAPGDGARAILLETTAERFFAHETVMREEVFGPSAVVLKCGAVGEMLRFAKGMEVSLSATVHGTPEDLRDCAELLSLLETKTGRVIINGFPTGLEVCTALQHGGGYPASTHGFFTSVGTNAIYRFVRPVCYQGFPDECLPEELKEANPRGIRRMVDGDWVVPD